MSTTNHELLTLREIFDSGKRTFIIPDYQRSYSWGEEQRKDIIDDIKQAQEIDYTHFTGTIVLSKSRENSDKLEIVDGQQRLTTLILLMLSLVRISKKLGIECIGGCPVDDIKSLYIVSGANIGTSEYRLELNHMQRDLFKNLINGTNSQGELKTKYDHNLIDAASQFEKHLSDKNTTDIEAIYKGVTKNLGFLVYAPDEGYETGLMFEVINNRGKSLSNLEKVKNYLIYFSERNQCGDVKDAVHIKWPEILKCLSNANMISNQDEDRFLRVCWLVFSDFSKKKSHYVYDELKERCPPHERDHWNWLKEFVEFLAKAANTYENMFQRSEEKESPVDKKLKLISLHTAYASIMPLVIAVDIKSKNDEDKEKLLDILEKLNFRYYNTWIAGRADSGQGELFHLAYAFYHKEIDQMELKKRLISFIDNNADDYTFVKHLTLDKDETGDYRGWGGIRFFLANYEKELCKENHQDFDLKAAFKQSDRSPEYRNDLFDVEHIWATKEWELIKDSNNPHIGKRRLGNFILLEKGVNQSVGNKRVEDKINMKYFNSKVMPRTEMMREIPEMFESSKEKWDKGRPYTGKTKNYWLELYGRFLDKREEKMINFALKRWRVDGVEKPVKKVKIDSSSQLNENFAVIWKEKEDDNE